MFLKEWFRSLMVLRDFKSAHIRLSPKEGERSPDLRIGVDVLILTFHVNRNLFKFAKVCNKAILVYPTMQKSSTTTLTSSTSNQDQINVTLDRLPVNETLHEVRAPEL